MDRHDLNRFRGLDMNHGFIKSIVKNQIDRDEYHKVMEERKIEAQGRVHKSISNLLIECKLYVPPHLRAKSDETTFKRDFLDRVGFLSYFSELYFCIFLLRLESIFSYEQLAYFCRRLIKSSSEDFQTDNAARLAKELGRKHGFTDDQCRMLRLTLERELEARLPS
ncbi:unnamed protein product [Angiostrongylus costaricensis]|uniref:Uncharacterized protein n=1 Tax=Angiostrongylus costaricensis TaxID=334426 RepID=A0A0R3PPA4_ANGCS|nr:unnamed protein product [Angiostrongylus costaricensis]